MSLLPPERIAAIDAALDAYPDRGGALREILSAVVLASPRGTAPATVLDDIMRILFHAQTHIFTAPPQNPQASHQPFLGFLADLYYEQPRDQPNAAAVAAARLLVIADVALALFRFGAAL